MSGRVVAVDPDAARNAARHILSGRQYRSVSAPRPLRKQLSWIGHRVQGVLDWIGRGFSHIPALGLYLLGLTVAAFGIAYAVRKIRERRGSPDARQRALRVAGEESEDPAELERASDDAERAGRLELALRLRFRAGLLRLGDRGAIRYRPSVTTGEVRRVLGSETFDELARTFEAVAYGGREAGPPDLDTARREWPRVVASAGTPSADRSASVNS